MASQKDASRKALPAHHSFVANRTTAINRLTEIREAIDLISATEKKDQENWGFAGSMSYAIGELTNLRNFLNGEKA